MKKSALQRMLESSEHNMEDAKRLRLLFNRNKDITGIREDKVRLNTIKWSRINGYLNIPNFRTEIWKKIPSNAYVICVQYYKDRLDNPADVQIGITGTCKKGKTYRYSNEAWDDCMGREVKEEIGMNLTNPTKRVQYKKMVGSKRGVLQVWNWDSVNFDMLNKLKAVREPVNKDLREDNKNLKVGIIIWTKNPDRFMSELKIAYKNGGLNRVLDDDIISILCVPKRYIINNIKRVVGFGKRKKSKKKKKGGKRKTRRRR